MRPGHASRPVRVYYDWYDFADQYLMLAEDDRTGVHLTALADGSHLDAAVRNDRERSLAVVLAVAKEVSQRRRELDVPNVRGSQQWGASWIRREVLMVSDAALAGQVWAVGPSGHPSVRLVPGSGPHPGGGRPSNTFPALASSRGEALSRMVSELGALRRRLALLDVRSAPGATEALRNLVGGLGRQLREGPTSFDLAAPGRHRVVLAYGALDAVLDELERMGGSGDDTVTELMGRVERAQLGLRRLYARPSFVKCPPPVEIRFTLLE